MTTMIVPPRSRSVMLPQPAQSDVADALATCRGAALGIALFSGMSNVLMLTGSFFMLEVYDRVLPSRSVPTLVALAIFATVLYAFQGILDLIRSRILVRIGRSLDEQLSRRVYEAVIRFPLKAKGYGDGLQPLRDLDQVRGFLAAGGPAALFDLPWIPLYLGICFLFHFWIGVMALAGAIVLVSITLLAELLTRNPTKAAAGFSTTRNALAAAGRRNAEVLQAMGMGGRMGALWSEANAKYLTANERASDVGGGLGALSKILRMTLGSAVLGVGAYLVIHQEATGGIIIASSILTTRALAPVELAISNWKGFVAARQGWQRLREFLKLYLLDRRQKYVELPQPRTGLTVEGISIAPPGETRLVVQDVGFALKAGQAVGIIGPSAAGKSSLARALVGVWQPVRGKVSLDGAPLGQWTTEALGRHIGYLPQDIELFEGAVAQNIARFEPEADPEAILAAAQAAGVHDLIVRLPQGYETRIGEGGTALSAGQRQRIALARALYGNPFLVVLDEPNSNLDAEGEDALTHAIMHVRGRGGIVVVIAHRPSALAGVDHVLVLSEGRAQAFGSKDEVLSKTLAPVVPLPMPLKVVVDGQGAVR
jgi:PrtD family type I secretion system ABC transporter